MGEYATNGVKMGTCEDMYYLRFAQRYQVKGDTNSVNPSSPSAVGTLRFRFPWPDEDGTPPGGEGFSDYGRSLPVRGYSPPRDHMQHGRIQFQSRVGLLLSAPCPFSAEGQVRFDVVTPGQPVPATRYPVPLTLHKNGYQGDFFLVQQKFIADPGEGRGPEVWSVGRCVCGELYRLDRNEGEALAVALRSMADRAGDDAAWGGADGLHAIADRVLAGYDWGQGWPEGWRPADMAAAELAVWGSTGRERRKAAV